VPRTHLLLLLVATELLLDASPLGMFLSSKTITLWMTILTTEIKIPIMHQTITPWMHPLSPTSILPEDLQALLSKPLWILKQVTGHAGPDS